MSDFDSPWKEALERFFRAFLAYFFPDIHAAIDWSRGHEMLDKELQQVVREAELGRRHVDKLVKVWRQDGEDVWVLVHVEVQSQVEEGFERRMYVYNYRLFDRYNREVVSLAVLADDQADWRPNRFHWSLWGCSAGIEYPVAKLLDYAADDAALEKNSNPFATVVLAHLKTQQTREDPEARQRWKLRVIKGLYERGWDREDVLQLFRFIDWMMNLPKDREQEFWHDVYQYEKEKQMPYVSHIERIAEERGREEGMRSVSQIERLAEERGREEGLQRGRERGLREGLLKGLALGLELKFGAKGKKLMTKIRAITNVDTLQSLHQALKTASSLEELRQALP